MPDLPQKKVGIVSCSGEELPEGTITRQAALKVLEKLRPGETVTICLPLFLAGGQGDRAFAKFYPTIALDGCEKRCAARGTEMYSNKPAASLVVSDLIREHGLAAPQGRRRLDEAGRQAVDLAAEETAALVDELLGRTWNRARGEFKQPQPPAPAAETVATCSCGSGIPIQVVQLDGREITLIALPVIFKNFQELGRAPSEAVAAELMDMVRIYNPIDAADEAGMRRVVLAAYAASCQKQAGSL